MAGGVERKRGGLHEGAVLEGIRPDLSDLIAKPGTYKPSQWGTRHNADDGRKGYGWLGVLRRLDNPEAVSTEISVGTNINGKDMDIPLIVPTLNRAEVTHLLSTPEDKLDFDAPIMRGILDKATQHAAARAQQGLSAWRD